MVKLIMRDRGKKGKIMYYPKKTKFDEDLSGIFSFINCDCRFMAISESTNKLGAPQRKVLYIR